MHNKAFLEAKAVVGRGLAPSFDFNKYILNSDLFIPVFQRKRVLSIIWGHGGNIPVKKRSFSPEEKFSVTSTKQSQIAVDEDDYHNGIETSNKRIKESNTIEEVRETDLILNDNKFSCSPEYFTWAELLAKTLPNDAERVLIDSNIQQKCDSDSDATSPRDSLIKSRILVIKEFLKEDLGINNQ